MTARIRIRIRTRNSPARKLRGTVRREISHDDFSLVPQSSAREAHEAHDDATASRRRVSLREAEMFLSRFRDACLKNKARLTRRFFRLILHGGNPRRTLKRRSPSRSLSLFPGLFLNPFVSLGYTESAESERGRERNDESLSDLFVTLRPSESIERSLIQIARLTSHTTITRDR